MKKDLFNTAALIKGMLPDRLAESKLHMHKALFISKLISGCENLLFSDTFEAWPYGPVQVDIHFDWKRLKETKAIQLDKKEMSILNDAVNIIKEFSIWDIVNFTHELNEWKDKKTSDVKSMSYEKIFKEIDNNKCIAEMIREFVEDKPSPFNNLNLMA